MAEQLRGRSRPGRPTRPPGRFGHLQGQILRHVPVRKLQLLPRRLAVRLLDRRSGPRADISDLVAVEVPRPFSLDVYWLRIDGDAGPAASLYLRGEEILRIDCLRDKPHLHYAPAEQRYLGSDRRVHFPLGPRDRHVERAQVELARNVPFVLNLHRRRSVRRAAIDHFAFERAARETATCMRDLIADRDPG